jgi:hypothetical protein
VAVKMALDPKIAPESKGKLVGALQNGKGMADLTAALNTVLQQNSSARKMYKTQMGADTKTASQPTYSNSSSGVDTGM